MKNAAQPSVTGITFDLALKSKPVVLDNFVEDVSLGLCRA